MKLIIGLGNPGPKYAGTRHNVGFDVVDELSRRHAIHMDAEKFHAWFGKGVIQGEPVVLLKPTTYMNRSGQAVQSAGRFYKLSLDDLLVMTDDMALPTGRLWMRVRGSSGNHNGLQDVIDRVGDDAWCRLRIGIGDPVGNPSVYVLSRFSESEGEVMSAARQRAADAAECWIEHGAELTMTRFNGEPSVEECD